MSTLDVRGDLFHRQRADRRVTAENVDIVANEADGADSGIISASAFALEFGENQVSPVLVRELGLFGIIGSHGAYLPRL